MEKLYWKITQPEGNEGGKQEAIVSGLLWIVDLSQKGLPQCHSVCVCVLPVQILLTGPQWIALDCGSVAGGIASAKCIVSQNLRGPLTPGCHKNKKAKTQGVWSRIQSPTNLYPSSRPPRRLPETSQNLCLWIMNGNGVLAPFFARNLFDSQLQDMLTRLCFSLIIINSYALSINLHFPSIFQAVFRTHYLCCF